MPVVPYLNFPGTCEEALNHYAKALGGTVQVVMRHADAPPEFASDPTYARRVMHAMLTLADGSLVFASDVAEHGLTNGDAVSLSISEPDVARAKSMFEALAEGGTPTMPLQPVFWGGEFGSLTDKYGMHWMVSAGGPA